MKECKSLCLRERFCWRFCYPPAEEMATDEVFFFLIFTVFYKNTAFINAHILSLLGIPDGCIQMYLAQVLWCCSSSGHISGGTQGKWWLVQVHRGWECLNGRSEGWFLLPGARCSPHAEVGCRSTLCLLLSALLSPGTRRRAVSPGWPGKGWAGRLHCETAPALQVQSKTPGLTASH